MDQLRHSGNPLGFAAKRKEPKEPAPSSTSDGAEPGPSSPETDPSADSPEPCECGFCDGVTIESGYDPRTGEAQSFEKMSRRTRCPVCGGVNTQYRNSYTAHAAAVTREKGRTRRAYFVTLVLDREAADRAEIDGDESYKVLTGDRGVWTRSRRAVRRRDDEAQYLGTLSVRPSDSRWHAHILVLTSLSRESMKEAFHVGGADTYISEPDGESHEQFGARKGAYAFDNAARSPSARFVSSRGDGVGYDSTGAVEGRRGAAQADSESTGEADPSAPARGPSRNEQRESENDMGELGRETAENVPSDGGRDATDGGRAPPVRCNGQTFGTLGEYLRGVKGTLTGRVGTTVYVRGLGNCTLLKVAHSRDGDGLSCTVHPLDVQTDRTAVVKWREIDASNAPTVNRSRNAPDKPDMLDTEPENENENDEPENDEAATDEGGAEKRDPVDRFYDEARYSTVTTELSDGRRRVSVKDHETGEITEHIKPPRNGQ